MSDYTDDMHRFPWLVRIIWFVFALGMFTCLIPVSGCDSQQKMIDPKASLEKIGVEYWTKRLIDKDYKATYDMEMEKGSIPFEKYLERIRNAGQILYFSVKAENIKIEKDKGTVDLIIEFSTPVLQKFNKKIKQTLPDTWVIKAGQWKHILPDTTGQLFLGPVSR